MLTPSDLDKAGELVAASYTQVEAEMLDYLTAKLIDGDITGQRSQTAILLLAQSSTPQLSKIIDDHEAEIDAAVRQEVREILGKSDARDLAYVKRGLGVELDGITNRQMAATVEGIEGILSRHNLGMVEGAKSAFIEASTRAVVNVNAGVMTTEKALHKAVRELEGKGISIVQYISPTTGQPTVANRVDVAVRRHVRTQLAQDGARRTEQIMDAAGIEFVEVSSHDGARPSHQAWEGRVYSRSGVKVVGGKVYQDFRTACHYGDLADGIYGANCRHSHGPYIPGMERTYKPNPEHPSGLDNTEVYELTQKQREKERAIRKTKRELRGCELEYQKTGSLEAQADANALKRRLQRQQADMRDFIDKANAKGKVDVLQRSPRREWAGDMPRVKVPGASGRKLDDYLAMPSVKKRLQDAGLSKTAARAQIVEMLKDEGMTAQSFPCLTSSQQGGFFARLKGKVDGTAKAQKGTHAMKPFTPATTVDEALDFAEAEFGIDRSGTMFGRIGVDGSNLINEGLYEVKQVTGRVNLRDIRYQPSFRNNPNTVAAYNPSWNGLFFTKGIKGKNAGKKMAKMQKENYEVGWWSNKNRFGVVNHEMGHYAHNILDSANGQSVCDHYLDLLLRRFRDEAADGATVDWGRWGRQGHTPPEVVKKARENGLSGYALTNTHEMVAEAFAELYDGDVSDQAREVLKTLLAHGDKINAPENALLKRRLEQL